MKSPMRQIPMPYSLTSGFLPSRQWAPPLWSADHCWRTRRPFLALFRDDPAGHRRHMGIHTDRAKEVFLDALEIDSPDSRRAFLDRECGGDDALRAEAEDLLAHHPQVGSFMATGPDTAGT